MQTTSPAPAKNSYAAYFASLPREEQAARLAALDDSAVIELSTSWRDWWARPDQVTPPGEDWEFWLILAGRGWGKTRTGAETTREWALSGRFPYCNLIAATADDARDIMIEGESGLLAICPRSERPQYLPSKRRLEWPNGTRSLIFTADEPERLRGKQHFKLWCDELGSWRYPDAWDQAMLGLRLGTSPQAVVTTTPRPTKIIKELSKDPLTRLTTGHTDDNVHNLALTFLTKIVAKYRGTRLGRQELDAEILDDNPHALWKREDIDKARVTPQQVPTITRMVVGVDPNAKSDDPDTQAECGIIAAGVGVDGEYYVFRDNSLSAKPLGWARAVVTCYDAVKADRVIAEVNNGGEMVEANIRTVDPNVAYTAVHASRGKAIRAEPIASLYEQGKVHHVGEFAKLEDQMCDWSPYEDAKSPDRLDALVWALTELSANGNTGLIDWARQQVEDAKKKIDAAISQDNRGMPV